MQTPFTRLDGLFLGAIIAIYRIHYGRPVPLRWGAYAGAVGAAMYLWVAMAHTQEFDGAGAHMWTTCVTSFALLSGCVLVMIEHRVEVVGRCLSWRPLLFAGRISYGIYVYHTLIFIAMGYLWEQWLGRRLPAALLPLWALLYLGLAVGTVTVVAVASYRWIETPMLRLKRFFPSRSPLV
jgi:peptidoglycan/LPS O-acetylase OafA/YrhL